MISYDKWKKALTGEKLPAALVDLDAFDRNLARLRRLSGGKRTRIATKSLRVPELIERVLASGPPFSGVMCYSAEEAFFLWERRNPQLRDFLIAYPTMQASDLALLRQMHGEGAAISMVVDEPAHLQAVSDAMQGVSRPFPLLLEVDLSLRPFGGLLHLGVRRSPLRTLQRIERLLDESSRFSNISIRGVMGYEAQVAGLGDRNPFKPLLNIAAWAVRALSRRRIVKMRKAVTALFSRKGAPLEIFNGGGTGSFNFAAQEESLTEITAGSALLCPHLFDYYSNIQFEPAGFFALQATRSSDPGYVTCLGGGYIASGEPGWDKVPRPYLPEDSRLVPTEGCGEVQTPLKLAARTQIAAGDAVLFRHAKAGEIAERFNEYLLVSGGAITGRAKTYRGFGRCFL